MDRNIEPAKERQPLGYIPIGVFIWLSLLTLGLYPFQWLWRNLPLLERTGGRRGDSLNFRRFAVIGLCVQVVFVTGVLLYAWGLLLDHSDAAYLSFRFFKTYLILYALLVLPYRTFCFLNLRWRIRREAARWDESGIAIGRTMPSWFKLFLFGSVYVQYHINRLMGLGMPGLGSLDDISSDFSITRWIGSYVRGSGERGARR